MVSGSGLALAVDGMLITISGANNAVKIMISEAASHGEKNEGGSRVKFSNDSSGREFDVVSDEYIAQAKPYLKSYGKSWRNQTKATFEAAQATGRKAYFQFKRTPADDILRKITEYGEIWN